MNYHYSEMLESFSGHEIETTQSIIQCAKRPNTADKYRRMLMLFLRGHYSSPENYFDFDHLSCYTWNPDAKQSTLSVDFTRQGDDANPEAYPGIYVEFPSLTLEKLGLNSSYIGHSSDGATTFTGKIAKAEFKIRHVAKNASDAYDLAELTTHALVAMAKPLITNAGALGLEVKGYNEPEEKISSPKDHFSVVLGVEVMYTLTVARTVESHRLRRIALVVQPANVKPK